jgi:DNA-binding IclR family transcriptional regulator
MVANMALCGHNLRNHCFSFLHRLMLDTGLTVHLAVMEEGEVILIDKIEPPGTRKVATWVGKRMGLHCTALGKALAAHLSAEEIDALVGKQRLIRHNDNTIASLRNLRIACERVKQLGYSIDDEEEEVGIRCIGAPVHNGDGGVVAAISISGTKAQINDIPTMAGLVKDCAISLSRHLGSVFKQHDVPFSTENYSDVVA